MGKYTYVMAFKMYKFLRLFPVCAVSEMHTLPIT